MATSKASNTPTACNKCNGEGKLWQFSNVMAGVCFSCKGKGVKHKLTRTKTYTDYWIVSCEGTQYPRCKSEAEAIEFAAEVECMHLEAPVINKVQHSQITSTRMAV